MIEPIYREFGDEIKERRLKADMTQGDLAWIVGLTRTSIVNIEAGNQRVLLHTWLLLMEATKPIKKKRRK